MAKFNSNIRTPQPVSKLRRALCALGPAATVVGGWGALSRAAAQPSGEWVATKPIRMVVPYPPGGGTDITARVIAHALGTKLGQPIIVDNKPGASGAIGSEFVYREPADGHVIQMTSNDTHSIYPHVNTKVRYKAPEFTPLSSVIRLNYVLMARPQFPAKTLADVIKLAQQKELTYGTFGIGTTPHVAMEMVRLATNAPKMVAVAYKGSGPATQALMSGEIDLMLVPSSLVPAYRSKLVTIGVVAPMRDETLKDVPALAEQGTMVDGGGWIALVGPPKMPAHIADTIHRRVQEALAEPEVRKRLTDAAMVPHLASRAQFDAYLKNEYRRWGEVVRASKIVLEE